MSPSGNQEGITENHQENPYAERFRTKRLRWIWWNQPRKLAYAMLCAVNPSVCPVVYSVVDGPRELPRTKRQSSATEPLLDYVWGCEAIVVDAQPSGYDVSIAGVLRKTWLSASF